MLTFRKIALKLAVLAGIPVVGVLLLSIEIERGARDRSRTADAIGSIEDLAELSARMSDTVDELQTERALASLSLGKHDPEAPTTGVPADDRLLRQEKRTDAAVSAMDGFLAQRDLQRLPPRLSGDLARARGALKQVQTRREAVALGTATINEVLEYYDGTNEALIDATAALTRLSNDGEMLRALSSLVEVMQVQECDSRAHAVLSHAFAKREFAPGSYRYLVTLVTEQRVHVASLQSFATPDQVRLYQQAMDRPSAAKSAAMLKKGLETTEDDFGIEADAWFDTQQTKVRDLAAVEQALAEQVRRIARGKVEETRRAVRYGEALAVGVVLLSLLLASAIGRGVTRSVQTLARVAGRVQREKDFSLRAVKTSGDELGTLTDAFNEMLTGIEDRDRELLSHRENLEKMVLARTAELSKRNDDMRLVLDTVDQGLVTIDQAGVMSTERSRAFDAFFGPPAPARPFYEHLAGGDVALSKALELDWSQITDGFLPLELVLAQAKDRFRIGDSYFALGYKPILEGEGVRGALLTLSNVTNDVIARRAEAAQREQIKTFARVMKDRSGFLGFFTESRRLLECIRDGRFDSEAEKLRAVHTLKGNAALFDVTSVANAAHELEQALSERAPGTEEAAVSALASAWDRFAEAIVPILGEDLGERCDVSRSELDELLATAMAGRKAELSELIERMKGEPVRAHFERIVDQLNNLCQRLGKPEPEIVIADGGVRLAPERFAMFWSTLAHIVRNIGDHGLQFAAERASAQLSPRNRVQLSAHLSGGNVVLEISDDGRGVDWGKVQSRARERGLPHLTRADLVSALFSPGLSTADVVTETSGRGVGMSAVLDACLALDGSCAIESEPGSGTRFVFTVPLAGNQQTAPPPRLSCSPLSRAPSFGVNAIA